MRVWSVTPFLQEDRSTHLRQVRPRNTASSCSAECFHDPLSPNCTSLQDKAVKYGSTANCLPCHASNFLDIFHWFHTAAAQLAGLEVEAGEARELTGELAQGWAGQADPPTQGEGGEAGPGRPQQFRSAAPGLRRPSQQVVSEGEALQPSTGCNRGLSLGQILRPVPVEVQHQLKPQAWISSQLAKSSVHGTHPAKQTGKYENVIFKDIRHSIVDYTL